MHKLTAPPTTDALVYVSPTGNPWIVTSVDVSTGLVTLESANPNGPIHRPAAAHWSNLYSPGTFDIVKAIEAREPILCITNAGDDASVEARSENQRYWDEHPVTEEELRKIDPRRTFTFAMLREHGAIDALHAEALAVETPPEPGPIWTNGTAETPRVQCPVWCTRHEHGQGTAEPHSIDLLKLSVLDFDLITEVPLTVELVQDLEEGAPVLTHVTIGHLLYQPTSVALSRSDSARLAAALLTGRALQDRT